MYLRSQQNKVTNKSKEEIDFSQVFRILYQLEWNINFFNKAVCTVFILFISKQKKLNQRFKNNPILLSKGKVVKYEGKVNIN